MSGIETIFEFIGWCEMMKLNPKDGNSIFLYQKWKSSQTNNQQPSEEK